MKKIILLSLLIGGVLFSQTAFAKKVKIGFVVKQPESGWFQDEWKFAEKAAKEKGFTLVKIAAEDGDKLMSAIDNLGAQQADGFIVCTPNVKLGKAIVRRAKQNKLKVMSVDDRFVTASGKPITSVPHIGISAYKIGQQVGESLLKEMKARKWQFKDVGAMALVYEQLPTAQERTKGAADYLIAHGFPKANIFMTPHELDNTEKSFNAGNTLIAKKAKIKKWLVFGMNDQVSIGGVRALEGNGIAAKNIIGIGINGSEEAINEFKKKKQTGFYGTVILSASKHGYESSIAMYNWITKGKKPAPITYTTGILATKANFRAVRKKLGLE